jgi:signal transduction histidine kinase/ActR/RegA family two-component response regulator
MTKLWKRMPLIALVTIMALLLAAATLIVYSERSYKTQKIDNVTAQARILASTVTAALAFNDPVAADEYIGALKANPEVQAAALYDADGALFASYGTAGTSLPATAKPGEASFENDRLTVTVPIAQAGAPLGVAYMQTIVEPFSRRFARSGVIAVLVIMASLVVAVLGVAHAALTKANAQLVQRAADLAEANRTLLAEIREREKAEEALRRAQRIEAIGQLTAGIAHDFNNLLTAVSGNLELLSGLELGDRPGRMIASARKAAARGARLTAQLLAFSRRQRLAPEPVNLNWIVANMEGMLHSTLGATSAIETMLAPDLPHALADSGQVELMILNLAINARDAMPAGGTITIRTSALHLGEPSRAEEPPAGDYVTVSVSDTGTGIARDVQDRVFEPFFTTKDVGKGSGLGLPQVLGVAQQLGGGVRLETRPGQGTTVMICLPRVDRQVGAGGGETADRNGEAAAGQRARLLLVDDDDDVRAVAATILQEAGHEVTEAVDGSTALEILAREREAIDLIVTDFAMPGLNGVDVAREGRRLVPSLRVLFVTGYADTAMLRENAAPEEVLQKPFRAADLLAKVALELAGQQHTGRSSGQVFSSGYFPSSSPRKK